MDLVGTIGQTEDTSPGEEMGQRSGARETHGTMSLRDRRERERERHGKIVGSQYSSKTFRHTCIALSTTF